MSQALNLPLHKENKSFNKSVLLLETFLQEIDFSCVKGHEDLRDLGQRRHKIFLSEETRSFMS